MSERSAAFGALAPPKTIEHNTKVYSFKPVMTHGVMLAVEAKLYDRAKKALTDLRADMDPAEYSRELQELRKRNEEGFYAFESEHTLEALQTTRGAILLLSCMADADEGELLELLNAKTDEVELLLNEALEASFPPDRRPKVQAPFQKVKGAKGKPRRRAR